MGILNSEQSNQARYETIIREGGRHDMYRPLDIDFEIPEILKRNIDEFVDDLNNNNGNTADCYEAEIRSILNGCDTCMTENQVLLMRNYYCRGGIYCANN